MINIPKQLWNCRGCGRGGDAIDLVQHLDGVDFKTAHRMLGGDGVKTAETKTAFTDEDNTVRALRLWNEAGPVRGTLAERYLRRRSLELMQGDDALRFHRSCPFGGLTYPCMIALFRDIQTNAPKAIHRTALGSGGIKLGRKALGPIGGCAIKLSDDVDVEQSLVIGEGVETVLAGMQLGFRPA